MELHWRTEIVKCCADVEDLTALLFELREGGATSVESSLKVNVDDGAEAIRRQLLSLAKKVSGGAINDDIDLAEMFNPSGEGALDLLGLTNISDNRECLTSVLVNGCSRGFEVLQLSTNENHTRASLRKCTGDTASDSSTTSCDECHVLSQNPINEDCIVHGSIYWSGKLHCLFQLDFPFV